MTDRIAPSSSQPGLGHRAAAALTKSMLGSDNVKRSNPSLWSLLSVMIITLALFVVLNSVSRVEAEKSRQVLQSIDATFGIPDRTDLLTDVDEMSAAESARLLQEVFQPLSSLVPQEARYRRMMAEEIEIAFPNRWLFPAGDAKVDPIAANLFREIRRVLATAPGRWNYAMELTLATAHPGDLEFERASAIAGALGIGAKGNGSTAIAIVPAGDDEILMALRVLPPTPVVNPAQTSP